MIDRFSANATPSALALVRGKQARPLWQQIKRGRGNVHEKNSRGDTLLLRASYNGNVYCARVLLAHGADVNVSDSGQWAPLHWAVWSGHINIVRVLLAQGANLYATTWQGETPLGWAIHRNYQDICKLLRAAMTR